VSGNLVCAVLGHTAGYMPGQPFPNKCERCGAGFGLPVTPQTITMPPVKPPLPSHSHWLPKGVDFADSPDYPKAGSPAEVAIAYLTDKDLNDINWDHRDELVNNQPVQLILEACEETNAPLAADEAFDGYEPGCTYWRTTGQKVKFTLTIKAEVEHA